MSEPQSAADRRPNDEPYFIAKTCLACGVKLVPAYRSNEAEPWYDEFECPNLDCRDGGVLFVDWPAAMMAQHFGHRYTFGERR